MDTLEGKIAVNLDIFRAVLAATSEDMYQYAQEVMTAQPDDIPGLIAANNAKRGVSLDDFAAYQGRLPSRWIWNMLPAPVRIKAAATM